MYADIARDRARFSRVKEAVAASVAANRLPACVTLCAALIPAAMASAAGMPAGLQLYNGFTLVMVPLYAVLALLSWAAVMAARHRPADLWAFLLRESARLRLGRRAIFALPFILLTPSMMSLFSAAKIAIPHIAPFSWDFALSEADRVLHGGRLPWEWLRPIIESPLIVGALNLLYNLWILVVPMFFLWQVTSVDNPAVRARFIATFFLCWFGLGNGLALAFASAGPCYFGLLLPSEADPYARLMGLLREANETVPVWALMVQDMLWDAHASGQEIMGGGISAMPSLHVSMVVLMVMTARHMNRWALRLAAAYAACIGLGSVVLGWHYAVDGYVSVIATVALWKAVGAMQAVGAVRARRSVAGSG